MVAKIAKKKTFLPLNFILASGYAASEDKSKFSITVRIATIILFAKYPKKLTLCHTSI